MIYKWAILKNDADVSSALILVQLLEKGENDVD